MIEKWLELIPMNVLSMGIDLLLFGVLLAMWVLWWRQAKRSERVETGLLEAAAQLQEATALLDDALSHIALLQRQESESTHKPIEKYANAAATAPSTPLDDDRFDDDVQPHFSSKARDMLNGQKANIEASSIQATVRQKPVASSVESNKQGVMDVAQILRMQREGASLDSIADTLNMPLAQVKLMLMLQKGA